MEFNFFSHTTQENVSVPVINDNNIEKRNEIAAKLFEKRKAILWNLSNREESSKAIYEEELTMNDLDLSTFGLTKIDYEIYLAKQKETLH